MHKFNHSLPADPAIKEAGMERKAILAELFDVPVESMGDVYIEPPFAVDYGYNIVLKGE